MRSAIFCDHQSRKFEGTKLMRLVMASDTHERHANVVVPDGDVVDMRRGIRADTSVSRPQALRFRRQLNVQRRLRLRKRVERGDVVGHRLGVEIARDRDGDAAFILSVVS